MSYLHPSRPTRVREFDTRELYADAVFIAWTQTVQLAVETLGTQ